ncbi:MAG: AAA domain-containing protein [Limisphaera sp.]
MSHKKTESLLSFLKAIASIRRKRVAAYGSDDKVLWMGDLLGDLPTTWKDACKSAFYANNAEDIPDLWLEVRKKRKPTFPPPPERLQPWIPQTFLDQPEDYADKDLGELVNILLVNPHVSEPDVRPEPVVVPTQTIAYTRHPARQPDVENMWLHYLRTQWKPWAEEIRSWKQIQSIYETVDFMLRRLEEAEERYELVLAVGLLQWRDSVGVTVKRHLLTAPAEITLDATRGVLTVTPAASFDAFRIELDMLDLQDRPRLKDSEVHEALEKLDVRAWDQKSVAAILRAIANRMRADAQVLEDAWEPLERVDAIPRILYAPALILRERRPTAYEEVVARFLDQCEQIPPSSPPWSRFVSEGEPSADSIEGNPGEDGGPSLKETRLYFPLPTNEEQRQIVERLQRRPYVVVKGPPGTGKSHTIANLICHLLATGERVLVTAHAAKALAVLRDLLPAGIRDLCVTAYGSSREDVRFLEDSVRGILLRKSEWKGPKRAQAEIERLENELSQLEEQMARIDRQIREVREAETQLHTLPGGYTGTAAEIARQVEKKRPAYDWFPVLADEQQDCPLQPDEVALLVDVHASLTPERLKELRMEIGELPLPDPEQFIKTLDELENAEHAARAARAGVSEEQLVLLQQFPDASLEACRAFLKGLDEQASGAGRILGDLAGEIIKDLLVGQVTRWNALAREVAELVDKMQVACERMGAAQIEISLQIERARLLNDVRERLEHFKRGGRRGWGLLAARVLWRTRYVETGCRVNGQVPRDPQSLEMLLGYLELKQHLETFSRLWPAPLSPQPEDPRRALDDVYTRVGQFWSLLNLFGECDRVVWEVIPVEWRERLTAREERAALRRLLDAELARRRAEAAKTPLETWHRGLRACDSGNSHPCLTDLRKAIVERNAMLWRIGWEKRDRVVKQKERVQEYENLLRRVQNAAPDLARLIRSTQGQHEWSDRLRHLQEAWHWAVAKAWVHRVANPDHYTRLTEERHRLQRKIEQTLVHVVSLKAWHEFFTRLDDATEQNLVAWTKAVARIGKGTGKHAPRHRRTARQYLMRCIPRIPAWVMPLHKLWEMAEASPGIFDTVIVDEASQAGIEALLLLLLAKRIVVVGDDKQNSPEAVGVLEEDIARLARDHLGEFRFQAEFRPDTSLYDHAERAFGNVISLREHFRCVPEIIRFSNDLCYSDAPLIPLRQPPPNRLPPLKTAFVPEGTCEGEGQRILNRAEAEAIVGTILRCLENEAYQGKTMGVIVLQGHAQAELIERRLAEVIEPRIREERKLRCGVSATFQGDQRDVMFLSLVVAPNHPFRALTELEAQRRFNVAMSRARDQVWLFHSIQIEDLSRDDLRYRLLKFFLSPSRACFDGAYEETERLERELKRPDRWLVEPPQPYQTWFEVEVAAELVRRKYRVRPELEVAGYRIDLVVEGQSSRLAVECDGETWYGPDQFEHDMARQRQFERAGWRFVRIRESEFYADRERALGRIVRACEELGIRPMGEQKAKVHEAA